MHISELSAFQNHQEAESDEVLRFNNSLQELKDLRSQLHYAADYCESTFLKAKEKKIVVENTKEYICRAFITVVDHLGNVSANLDDCIPNSNAFSEAELRINSLKQRLLSCELYTHKLALNRFRWNPALPRYNRRYSLSSPASDVTTRSNENSRLHGPSAPIRDSKVPSTAKITEKQEFDTEDVPLCMYRYPEKSSSSIKNLSLKNSVKKGDPSLALVRDGISILSKDPNPTFHFQLGGTQNRGRKNLHRRSFQSTEIMSFIWRIKRTS